MLTFIPDIVEQHYDEVQFLWAQRRVALRSPSYTERGLASIEHRVEAHVEGMVLIGERLAELVEPGLLGDEEMPAFAGAFGLLRLQATDSLGRVMAAFQTATGKKVCGLRDALAHGPSKPLTAQLASLVRSASPATAAAAGEVLAFHGAFAPVAPDLQPFIRAEDPATRTASFRLASYCNVSIPPEWYELGILDDDAAVTSAALTAAAWNASPVFAPYCRALAAAPTPESIDALTTFASIAPPEDYQLIGSIASNPAAGPNRFRVIGSFAHPYFIDLLTQEMSNPDPVAAVAAGQAFFKMTGRDVESNNRVKVSPDGKPPADDFEAEFMDEVFLPDPELARRHWNELAPTLARSPRICRGMDVSQPLSREQFAALDRESVWEYCLRMRRFSGWQGTPLVLERYPQRF